MEKLYFILWMLLFPIVIVLVEYISAKTREITKEKKIEFSKNTENYTSFFMLLCGFI